MNSRKIKNKKFFFNKLLRSRYNLGENDQGIHKNKKFNMQEWWYYNVYFNNEKSELKNCTIVISFVVMPNVYSLKVKLCDENNKSYTGGFVIKRNFIEDKNSNFSIKFNNKNFLIGKYPKWQIHTDNTDIKTPELIVNLTFKANSLPMWILKNTGHNRSNSFFGYYCVMNCNVKGNITLDGKTYNVSGIGYHDHTWAPLSLQKQKFNGPIANINNYKKNKSQSLPLNLYKNWDWLCIHFENGWDMFVGKFYLLKIKKLSKFTPGNICFTPSGKKLYESHFFLLNYEKTINSEIPNIKIPTKIHIKALILNTFGLKLFKGPILFDLNYEAESIQSGPKKENQKRVLWQSQGKIYGVAKSLGKTVKLKGWAITETTVTP